MQYKKLLLLVAIMLSKLLRLLTPSKVLAYNKLADGLLRRRAWTFDGYGYLGHGVSEARIIW